MEGKVPRLLRCVAALKYGYESRLLNVRKCVIQRSDSDCEAFRAFFIGAIKSTLLLRKHSSVLLSINEKLKQLITDRIYILL